jgi:hypothetical protein
MSWTQSATARRQRREMSMGVSETKIAVLRLDELLAHSLLL